MIENKYNPDWYRDWLNSDPLGKLIANADIKSQEDIYRLLPKELLLDIARGDDCPVIGGSPLPKDIDE